MWPTPLALLIDEYCSPPQRDMSPTAAKIKGVNLHDHKKKKDLKMSSYGKYLKESERRSLTVKPQFV